MYLQVAQGTGGITQQAETAEGFKARQHAAQAFTAFDNRQLALQGLAPQVAGLINYKQNKTQEQAGHKQVLDHFNHF